MLSRCMVLMMTIRCIIWNGCEVQKLKNPNQVKKQTRKLGLGFSSEAFSFRADKELMQEPRIVRVLQGSTYYACRKHGQCLLEFVHGRRVGVNLLGNKLNFSVSE
ncbi:hypothetical protein MKX01_036045, partial [Papaver californicum]